MDVYLQYVYIYIHAVLYIISQVYIYMYVYIYIYIYIYMYVCIYIYVYVYLYIYIQTHTLGCSVGMFCLVLPSIKRDDGPNLPLAWKQPNRKDLAISRLALTGLQQHQGQNGKESGGV